MTIDAVNGASQWSCQREINFFFVLQPNVFTRSTREPWDNRLIASTSRDLSVLLDAAYQEYLEWIINSPIAVDATHIFDDEERSPYLDWAHVNSRGNELIAEFVYGELMKRGMLGPMPESTPS